MGKNFLKEENRVFLIKEEKVKNNSDIPIKIKNIIEEAINYPDKIPENRFVRVSIKIEPHIYNKFRKVIKEKGWKISEYINTNL